MANSSENVDESILNCTSESIEKCSEEVYNYEKDETEAKSSFIDVENSEIRKRILEHS